jgi:hypothetical protein
MLNEVDGPLSIDINQVQQATEDSEKPMFTEQTNEISRISANKDKTTEEW